MTSRDVAALHEAPTEVVEASQPPAASVDPGDFQIGPEPVAAVTPVEEAPPAPAAPASSPSASPRPPAPDPEDGFSLELPVPNPDSPDRERLESILSKGVNEKASDIHLHAGGPLKQRVNGELIVTEQQIESAEVERMVAAALTPEQRQVLGHDGEIDFCIDLPGIGRFRANAYRQQRGLDVVFRTVRETPPTFEELGLPDDLKKYTDYHQGMVLITGPAGCGKSSTLAALVNHINENRDDHIPTVEDPIEIIHPSKRCLVNQRHAGHHTASFSRALRGALREDPDIIVIGELRDLETISLAMTAAETGHFVLATLHTANAVRTVNRMIGAFPSNEQDQVRAMLSESLRAVVSQRLVPAADGQGRVPALELLVINRAIGNLIRDEKTVQIRSSMQTGKAHGMYLLEQSLNELVAAGNITREVALSLAEEEKLITAGA
ncbi:MAG: twitching motility protein PilT [Deltaproteobacteria bacterium]|nr:twitching motility protein PilT [Deltaproteobacteria bacterium]